MTWVERVFGLFLILPIVGLLDDALGRYSNASWMAGLERLVYEPAMAQSFVLSFWVASISLFISLYIAQAVSEKIVLSEDATLWRSLLLAMPHSALAIGLLLALSSGGVAWRWLSLGFGFPVDLQYLFPRDPWGLGAILSLVIKESAFLIAIAIPIAKRLPLRAYESIARQSGMTHTQCHHQLIWPQVVRSLGPALFVVFVFGLTNLEVSLILGPDQPQLIGVRLFQLLTDPDALNRQAGSIGLLVLLLVLILIWLGFQMASRHTRIKNQIPVHIPLHRIVDVIKPMLTMMTWLSIVSLLLWSVTLRWSVLDPLPTMSFEVLNRLIPLGSPMMMSLIIGLCTSVLAVSVAILILEHLMKSGRRRLHWIWWAFLWMPALPMASGLLAWVYVIGAKPGILAVIVGHTLIALPYVMIVVSDTWFDRDTRHDMILGQAGLSMIQRLFYVWIPRHSRLLIIASAVAFAVSCALYTQTVLLGGGRVGTLMTELMATIGSERRGSALTGIINLVLPLGAFLIALGVNRSLWKQRLGMQGKGYADFR